MEKREIAMSHDPQDAPGNQEAQAGLNYFLAENYQDAAESYAKAVELQPDQAAWQTMAFLAKENQEAAIQLPIPPFAFFDPNHLLAEPSTKSGDLPTPLPPPGPPSFVQQLRNGLGTGVGAVCSVALEGVTAAYGNTIGYRDRVWTNWYRRPLPLGILTLAYMRNQLNRHNLKDTYPADSLTAFLPKGLTPPEGATHFRTADGTWNNFDNPKEGAAGTRFPRNVELATIVPETGERLMSPNPRTISRVLLERGKEMLEVPFLNLLAASWIQFQNDDWVNHGERLLDDFHEIPLGSDDPIRLATGQETIRIGKTQADPTRRSTGEDAPVSFINEVTHWWDGSQIYGSDLATQKKLRSGVDGKMALNDDGTLPRDEQGMEMSGMVRNWWVGLAMLHTLFVREHNAICDKLKSAYPSWDDNRLFNVARLINAAVMAKIHTVEWTPAVLPNPGLDAGMNANWYGILTNLFHKGKARKTYAPINVRNPELGGVVGNPIDKHGCHYGLAEEFVEVYRLHSFLPETLKLRHTNEEGVTEVPFAGTRQLGAHKIATKFGMGDLFFSFGNQLPGQLVLNNYPDFMRRIAIPGSPMLDLAALDILRARERGVPRYNEFRRQLGLNPITCFEDLTDDPAQVAKLKEVYGTSPEAVDDLDLLVGTLGESVKNRPTHFGFGETLFQIFILNATRRLQADRFYTDCYTAEYYTQEGLDWIDDASLKTVILRHYPELEATGLGNIKNAFEPWDNSAKLDPDRHPLRACDPEVKSNPWVGDRYR